MKTYQFSVPGPSKWPLSAQDVLNMIQEGLDETGVEITITDWKKREIKVVKGQNALSLLNEIVGSQS